MLPMVIIALAAGLTVSPASTDPLRQEQVIAAEFVSRFHIATLPFDPTPPLVEINSTPTLSYYQDNSVHEARFDELPDPAKALFSRWAGYAGDEPSGKMLFDDMFYRFSLFMRWGTGLYFRRCIIVMMQVFGLLRTT